MPREGDDAAFLWDMLEAAESVLSMTGGMTLEQYRADRKTRRAVEREIEIIGEAARGISASFCDSHPELPWRKIIAQRHRLAHEYAEIQDEIVWRVVTVHIPEMIQFLRPLLPAPPSTDAS